MRKASQSQLRLGSVTGVASAGHASRAAVPAPMMEAVEHHDSFASQPLRL